MKAVALHCAKPTVADSSAGSTVKSLAPRIRGIHSVPRGKFEEKAYNSIIFLGDTNFDLEKSIILQIPLPAYPCVAWCLHLAGLSPPVFRFKTRALTW